ncbi:hypothetical protein HanXRQr2_Chr06g0251131 [Helianthus annuus]|uniref:Uncharacterized protein n=1 Tax=Helianthus annuus TaxID=4232 RepID=A0A9K3IRH7_HELAN|nr:hypothetical protein HanXRQr2_Chr06g0251131 [Helianthus annuus]
MIVQSSYFTALCWSDVKVSTEAAIVLIKTTPKTISNVSVRSLSISHVTTKSKYNPHVVTIRQPFPLNSVGQMAFSQFRDGHESLGNGNPNMVYSWHTSHHQTMEPSIKDNQTLDTTGVLLALIH